MLWLEMITAIVCEINTSYKLRMFNKVMKWTAGGSAYWWSNMDWQGQHTTFLIQFSERTVLYFHLHFIDMFSVGQQHASIGSDNCLTSHRRKAITWIDGGLLSRRIRMHLLYIWLRWVNEKPFHAGVELTLTQVKCQLHIHVSEVFLCCSSNDSK